MGCGEAPEVPSRRGSDHDDQADYGNSHQVRHVGRRLIGGTGLQNARLPCGDHGRGCGPVVGRRKRRITSGARVQSSDRGPTDSRWTQSTRTIRPGQPVRSG